MRVISPILLVIILFLSCRKPLSNKYSKNSLELTKTEQADGTIVYEWSLVDTDDFIEYAFYVSNFPINDVYENGQVEAQELMTFDKKKDHIFIDSFSSTFDQKYVKVIARLENSILSSPTLVNENIQFLQSETQSSTIAFPVQSEKLIVTFNRVNTNTLGSVINYETNKILVDNKTLSGNNYSFLQGTYNNEPAFYNFTNNRIDIYRARDLEKITSQILVISNQSNNTGVYLKNNIFCYRGYASTTMFLYNYDLSLNQVVDSFDKDIINVPPLVRYSNPNTVAYINNSSSQLTTYTVSSNGRLSFDKTVSSLGKTISNSIMTQGDKEYFANQLGQVYDKNLQLVNDFTTAPNIGSVFLGVSPNMQYYLYRSQVSIATTMTLFKNGQNLIYQRRNGLNLPQLLFLDNEHVIYFYKKNIGGKLGYLINKTPLEP